MNLHSTYETVKLSLLTQPTEPSLDVICSILTPSSSIIDAPFAVKSEGTEMALATKFGRSSNDRKGGPRNPNATRRNNIGCPGHHHNKSEGGIEDSKGFCWGDVTSENCHCCGCKGHIAALCVADIPPDIKSCILGESLMRDEESLYIHKCSTSSPCLSLITVELWLCSFCSLDFRTLCDHWPPPLLRNHL